jgi:hypothetical protein
MSDGVRYRLNNTKLNLPSHCLIQPQVQTHSVGGDSNQGHVAEIAVNGKLEALQSALLLL